jgi:hypothetical protein
MVGAFTEKTVVHISRHGDKRAVDVLRVDPRARCALTVPRDEDCRLVKVAGRRSATNDLGPPQAMVVPSCLPIST